jgi:hypothetical protein
VSDGWDQAAPGVLQLPSGRLVRGRALRRPLPDGPPPTVGLYLLRRPPRELAWETHWLRWPDWWLPSEPLPVVRRTLADLLQRAAEERLEVACSGGRGRTGTALACLAVLDGLTPPDAVRHVRTGYDRRAVETPWQRRLMTRLAG